MIVANCIKYDSYAVVWVYEARIPDDDIVVGDVMGTDDWSLALKYLAQVYDVGVATVA